MAGISPDLGISLPGGLSPYAGISLPGGASYNGAATTARYMASNGNVMPYGQSGATTNNYRYNFKKRCFVTAGSNVRLTYCNFWVGNGFEQNGDFPFTIQAGLLDTVTGIYYPASFGGASTATVAVGGYQTGLCALTAVAGRDYIECNLVVGPSGSVAYLYSHPSVAYRDEGFIEGTSAGSVYNLATGAGIGRLAAGTAVLTANTVSSVTVTNGGNTYDTVGLVYFLANEAGGKDANYYATILGGAIDIPVPVDVGSGFVTPPAAFLNNSYAKDTAIYAASICTVESSSAVVSAVICGDSIARGYTSSDAYGDSKGNFGILERAFNSTIPVLNLSIAGMSAAGFAFTKQKAAITGAGVTINYCLVETGINDVTAGTTFANIATANKVIADYWRTQGAKIQFTTLLPSTTGTWTGDPSVNQTANTGAGSAGVRTTYNAAVRSGSDSRLVGDYPCLDISYPLEDRTYPWAWNGSAGIALTSDGSHPRGWSDAPAAKTGTTYNFFPSRGIEYFVTNFVAPTIYPTGFIPSDLANLGVWMDGQDYTKLTFNVSNISQWANKGNKGVGNATQGTALNQPLYVASGINGKPALEGRADGVNGSLLRIADNVGLDHTELHLFAVIQMVTDRAATVEIGGKYTTTGNQREHRIIFNSARNIGGATSADGISISAPTTSGGVGTFAVGTPLIAELSFTLTGTLTAIRINGNLTSATSALTTSLFNGTALYDLFAREVPGTESFAGRIGEWIEYETFLQSADRLKVLRYLSAKWGIALT